MKEENTIIPIDILEHSWDSQHLFNTQSKKIHSICRNRGTTLANPHSLYTWWWKTGSLPPLFRNKMEMDIWLLLVNLEVNYLTKAVGQALISTQIRKKTYDWLYLQLDNQLPHQDAWTFYLNYMNQFWRREDMNAVIWYAGDMILHTDIVNPGKYSYSVYFLNGCRA